MQHPELTDAGRAFTALRRFTRVPATAAHRCELCGVKLLETHEHLIEPACRRLLCACLACSMLFDSQAQRKYARVPRETRSLPDMHVRENVWDGLMIPINMAFFTRSSLENKMIAIYPSPAGPVESLLTLPAWQQIEDEHSSLSQLRPDVEALLVNRMGARFGFATEEYFVTPIDECYKLVGILRMHWRGLSGGNEVWEAVRCFFDRLRCCKVPIQEEQHA